MSHWNTLQGGKNDIDRSELQKIFNKLDTDKDGSATLDEYKREMKADPNLFKWYEIFNNIHEGEIESKHHDSVNPFELAIKLQIDQDDASQKQFQFEQAKDLL